MPPGSGWNRMGSLDVYRRDVHEVKGVGGKVENMQKTKMVKKRK